MWVWGLRQKVCKQQRPKETHACSHVGQALSLQNVWQVLHTSQLPTETHEGKYVVSGNVCWTVMCVCGCQASIMHTYDHSTVCVLVSTINPHLNSSSMLDCKFWFIYFLCLFIPGPRILSTSIGLITSSQLWLWILHTSRPRVSHHRDPKQHHPVPSLSCAQHHQPQWPILQFQWMVCLGLSWNEASHTHFTVLDRPAGDWDTCTQEAHKHLFIFYFISNSPGKMMITNRGKYVS